MSQMILKCSLNCESSARFRVVTSNKAVGESVNFWCAKHAKDYMKPRAIVGLWELLNREEYDGTPIFTVSIRRLSEKERNGEQA